MPASHVEPTSSALQTCQPSRIFGDNPGNLTSLPEYCCRIFFTSRSMRCVIVVRARNFKINSNSIYTHYVFDSALYVFDSALYLCPARDVKLEKRLDVCAQGKRASKITLSRTHDIRAALL